MQGAGGGREEDGEHVLWEHRGVYVSGWLNQLIDLDSNTCDLAAQSGGLDQLS